MKLKKKIADFIKIDNYIKEENKDKDNANLIGLCSIASVFLVLLSILNFFQKSYLMLIFTVLSCVVGFLLIVLNARIRNNYLLRIVMCTISFFLFSYFIILGGNNGFAALWILVMSNILILAVDFELGFLCSAGYLLVLIVCFYTPLRDRMEHIYTSMFMLRFPFLYACSLAFTVFFSYRYRQSQYQLLMQKKIFEEMGLFDYSTGLKNRNSFNRYLEEYKSSPTGMLTCIYVDINGLHALNNKAGHNAGDALILTVARRLKANFSYDECFRIGGDEFVIFSEETDMKVIESKIQSANREIKTKDYSVSWGCATHSGEINIEALLEEADQIMLKNKAEGKKSRTQL